MPLQLSNLFEGCCTVDPAGLDDEVLKQLPTSHGLILFTDSAAEPIQLLCAANIRRTARARLTAPAEDQSQRKTSIREITAGIYYLSCFCDFRSSLKYYEIAKKLFPDSYTDLLAFGKPWYLKIDTSAPWPRFSITEVPVFGANQKIFGPFYGRKSAADFKNALEEAFLLCRRPNLIANPQKAKSCPYFQMHTCRRPCIGDISKSQYTEQITAAIKAIENVAEQKQALIDQMRQLSENLNFEKAQTVKKQLDNLNILERKDYQWLDSMDSLALLHIDKSAKIKIPKQRGKVQTYAAFLIMAGEIIEFGDFKIEDAPILYKLMKEKLSTPTMLSAKSEYLAEKLSITAYYLYRSSSPGLWLKCKQIDSVQQITDAIKQTCCGKEKS